ELVRLPEPVDQAIDQLRERAGTQQVELALLRLAQDGVVARGLLGQLGEPLLQGAVLRCELLDSGGADRSAPAFSALPAHRLAVPPVPGPFLTRGALRA